SSPLRWSPLAAAALVVVGCSARGPSPGLYERRTIHLSAAGQEVNLPTDYGLNDAFPSRVRIVDRHTYEVTTGDAVGRGQYRVEHDSLFFEDAGRVVMAGKVVDGDNTILVHLLGNAAAMSGGVQTDVLIQFAKSQ
ncbi:MAG TPA: hypothetical protein VFD67_05145, partial [Gemmatimonadaceae bacterium]|nr:hypothetical protein [Gemmatimonadaceae bacterium]